MCRALAVLPSAFGPLRSFAIPSQFAIPATAVFPAQAGIHVGAPRGMRYPAVAHAGAVSAERVDCPAVLAPASQALRAIVSLAATFVVAQRSGRGTRCVRCAVYGQTAAAFLTSMGASRADRWAAFLGAAEIAPAGYRLPRGWVVGVRWSGPRQPERQRPPHAFAASPENTRRTPCREARQRSRIGNLRMNATGRKRTSWRRDSPSCLAHADRGR